MEETINISRDGKSVKDIKYKQSTKQALNNKFR